MNITILLNHDLASNIALNYLVKGLTQHRLTVFVSEKVGNTKGQIPRALETLGFFEQPLFNQILCPQTNNRSDTSRRLSFDQLSSQLDSPITSLNNINQPEGLKKLRAANPELILSIRFGKILHQEAINIPKHGVLNLHSGLLPQYQGVMATFWAMYHREPEYGVTLHYINNAAIDAGPIVNRLAFKLDSDKSYLENLIELYQPGCNSMIKATNLIASGIKPDSMAQSGEARYYTFPDERQIETFHKQNMQLFNIEHIMNLVKSYQ